MVDIAPFFGALPAVLTPFRSDLTIDTARHLALCRWLLDRGVDGLAIFGTTGEGNSLGVAEKIAALEALVAGGIPAATLLVGTGACALPEAIAATRAAVAAGAGGVLTLPPFYYKEVTLAGLEEFYGRLIEGVADPRLRLYLYHIPPVAQVGIPVELITRLRERYGAVVVGIKDSSGDWQNTRVLLERFPGFGVFAGTERFLLDTLRGGGVGCISAVGNVAPAALARLMRAYRAGAPASELDELQFGLTALRPALAPFPMIPMLKAAHAFWLADPDWARVRPPLVALEPALRSALEKALATLGLEREA